MSSTHQRYRAIQTSLMQTFGHPTGHKARHVQTLVALICGIVGSTHSQIPHIADHVPNHQAKTSSVIQRMTRWHQNDAITTDTFFLPFVALLLVVLAAARPLGVIIDGSTMGRGCITLMASVVYRGRAIPIAWTVVSGRKGHLPESTHLTLVDEVQRIVPCPGRRWPSPGSSMARCMRLPSGMPPKPRRSICSPICLMPPRRCGTSCGVRTLRRSSRTRRVAAFTSTKPHCRSQTAGTPVDCRVSGLHLDHLSGSHRPTGWLGGDHPSPRSL